MSYTKRTEIRTAASGQTVHLWDADKTVELGTVENATLIDSLPLIEHDDGTVQIVGHVRSTLTGYFRPSCGLRSMTDVFYHFDGGLGLFGNGKVKVGRGTVPGEIEVALNGGTHPEHRYPDLLGE